eukprot:TRINITY_DN15349_c0_g1_i1.p1 TRINITY_DN15349_c0_g1~~TRINITY_DN15349_c0_g1_i1.p1  ORF type:complete len:267 (-),score=46.58 TRINITY_DN15349_c0_g1_i1:172-972(-)
MSNGSGWASGQAGASMPTIGRPGSGSSSLSDAAASTTGSALVPSNINTATTTTSSSSDSSGSSSSSAVTAGAANTTTTTTFQHASGIVPVLQNVVSTVNLGTRLDLKKIALKARNAEYKPQRFPAVIVRIRKPQTTALIFASGKVVCTGARSEDMSRLAARKYARMIQKLDFPAKFMDFEVRNIVGSCDVKFPIRLEGLAYAHNQFSSYEPELFPGLIYRMVQPKVVLLIFVSGKIVLTGARFREEIYQAFENIYPVVSEFRKNMN